MLQTDKAAWYGRFKNTLSIAGSAAVLIICLSVLCAFSIVKNVEINDGYGRVIPVVTMKATVGELLDEQQITLNEGDAVSPAIDQDISHEDKIMITRAVDIKITVDGQERIVRTTGRTVEQALLDAGVILEELDECNYPVKDRVFDNMEISVARVRKSVITEESAIAYNTVKQNDANLAAGTEVVVQEGQNGVLTKTYNVITRDGVEVDREFAGEAVTVNPVDRIVKVGTKFELGAKIPVDQLSVKAKYVMNATAYDAGFESCGKHPGDPGYGITATGMRACYGVVAVDPRVIPLGSKVYVTSADGSYVYGCAIAADTGGAIKGNRIDLFYPSRADALQFGRRNVVVYVLN